MFLAKTKIVVQSSDLNEMLDTILPLLSADASVCNIEVCPWFYDTRVLDLLPLFRARAKHPGLRCNVQTLHGIWLVEMLDQMEKSVQWRDFLLTDVHRMQLVLGHTTAQGIYRYGGSYDLLITLKASQREWWMGENGKRLCLEDGPDLVSTVDDYWSDPEGTAERDWVRSKGFPVFESAPVTHLF